MVRLRALFGIFILVAGAYVLWQVIPPIFNNYQFEDIIGQEARAGSYSHKTEDDIQELIFEKAKDLDLPVTRQQIKVKREGAVVSISVAYTVHIDLPIYPFDLNFNPSSQNKRL